MSKTKKDFAFKPGRVYFMEDFMNEDGESEYAKIYDLTTLEEDKAAKILERALKEEKEANKAK